MIHTSLDLVVPELRIKAAAVLAEMLASDLLAAMSVTVAISETLRDLSVQMAYFSRGRMAAVSDVQAMYRAADLYAISAADAVKKITWTLASEHLSGRAIDFVPKRAGIIWWAAPLSVWERMGEIGERHGLEWGGRWKYKDCPHFQIPGGSKL